MNRRCRQLACVVLILAMAVAHCMAAWASDDNSLADLGIKTPGATVSPEFRYDIWEYSVEVPAGTQTLELAPHTTNPNATVNSVTGETLSADGTGRVVITVTSESGNAIEYVLNVSQSREAMDPAEAIAANESAAGAVMEPEVVQSEVETEDPRYVKVDRNSLQDAENTIEKLQKTITEQRSHINMLTYVLYALIAVSIIFLFIVISQLLRRRDIAQELAFYKQEDAYRNGGTVAEDGWGDWGEDDVDRSRRKKKKKDAPEDDGWEDHPGDSAISWTDQQVGTPVRPQTHRPARGQDMGMQPGGMPAAALSSSMRQPGSGGRRQDGYRQNGYAQDAGRSGGYPQDGGRQNGYAQDAGRQGANENTRRYEGVPPVHPQQVPKDVTKDLTRVNKAEARAMKKAAAVEAKREQEARKTAAEQAKREQEARKAAVEQAKREEEARRADRNRAQEAKRQAQEAERIAREQEAARQAQENALREAQLQNAPHSGDDGEDKGKNVKIRMVDL